MKSRTHAFFSEAIRLVGADPRRIMHVGDTVVEDIGGAVGAGLRAILLDRHNVYNEAEK